MFVALIPARYDSTRLPGKPLLKFGNKTMIQMVYEKTNSCKTITTTYVVTDDERISNNIKEINGNVIMVKNKCLNGTERICLAIKQNPELFINTKYIVNVQGDEPYIKSEHIEKAIFTYCHTEPELNVCSTLHYLIKKEEDLYNKSIGKLVLDNNNNIIYCSRNCIPYNKEGKPDINKVNYYGHIGLFVFDKNYLINEYCKTNTYLQIEEDIEWLKIIENGFKINSVCITDYEIGVNVEEDYQYLIKKYT